MEPPQPPPQPPPPPPPEPEADQSPEVELVGNFKSKLMMAAQRTRARGQAIPGPETRERKRAAVEHEDVEFALMPEVVRAEVKAPAPDPEVKAPAPDPGKPPGIYEVRQNPRWWPQFRQFTIDEHSDENTAFIEAVDTYKATNPRTWLGVSAILNQYIVAGAPREVNTSSGVRSQLSQFRLPERQVPAVPPEDLFGAAYGEIMDMLGRDTLARFRKKYPGRDKDVPK